MYELPLVFGEVSASSEQVSPDLVWKVLRRVADFVTYSALCLLLTKRRKQLTMLVDFPGNILGHGLLVVLDYREDGPQS